LDLSPFDHVAASNHDCLCALQLDIPTIRRSLGYSPQMPAMRAHFRLVDTVSSVS